MLCAIKYYKIMFSKFAYNQHDIDERNYHCEHYPEDCHDEEYYYNEINKQLDERFHIGYMLPICFIDSWSQTKENVNDTTQQTHFLEETQKLWDFAKNNSEFKFKSIDEVLEENAAMRDEIDWLNEIITKNITDLQGKYFPLLDI